jgi:glycosyltransferase involved in cell wall biosynthesis
MTERDNVSIIIPCRNEEKYIGKCLDSIIESGYPENSLEILVVDGMSDDGTRDIIQKYSKNNSFIKLLNNHKKIVPTALNIGIKSSSGDIIIRLDAHTAYEKNYIVKSVKYLKESNADNVGGVCITLPGSNTVIAETIAIALSHPFGIGNSYFRIGLKEPKYVDTVAFGCFRRDVFKKVGLFDEDMVRNQDDEFNFRINKNGGKVLLVPDIVSYYYARDSLLKLWKMYYQYGYFKPLAAKKSGAVLTWRQLIPPAFIGSLITTGVLSFITPYGIWLFLVLTAIYVLVNFTFSFLISIKKGVKYLVFIPVVFAALHFSYGLGYLKGVMKFIILKKNKVKQIGDIPLTR